MADPAAQSRPAPARIRSLSVAAPAYNEAAVLGPMIDEWMAALAMRGYRESEVVICDDGSTDGTADVLRGLQARHPTLRVVTHRPNRGAGAAMASAIAATRGEWVLLLDADGQFPIDCLDALESALAQPGRPELAAVFGAREKKQDSLFARAGSRASSLATNLLLGTHYRDFNSTCRLVDGALLRALPLEARGLNYSTEITARLIERGVPIAETTVRHLPRDKGHASRTAIRSTLDRLLFVSYLGVRRLLLRQRVIDHFPRAPLNGKSH